MFPDGQGELAGWRGCLCLWRPSRLVAEISISKIRIDLEEGGGEETVER